MARKKRTDLDMEGLWQKSSGRWRVVLVDPRTGKRTSGRKLLAGEPTDFATLHEAAASRDRIRASLARGVAELSTVRAFAERWTDPDDPDFGVPPLGFENRKPRTEQTLITHASHLSQFVRLYGDHRLDEVDAPEVNEFKRSRYANASALRSISALFGAALRLDPPLVQRNPFARVAKNAETAANRLRDQYQEDNPLPAAQILAMLDHARAEAAAYKLTPGGTDCSPGFYGWLHTAIWTGMRHGELDAMRWENLSRDDNGHWSYLVTEQFNNRVQKLTPTKGKRRRTVVIPADVLVVIEGLRSEAEAAGSPFIFLNELGEHFRGPSRAGRWDRLRGRAGDVPLYRATRHLFAHECYEAGMSAEHVGLLLGHAGRDRGYLASRVYIEATHRPARDAALAFHARRNEAA